MVPTGEDRPEVPTRTADEWLEAVLRSERRGELLTAFDLAERGLVEHPEDVRMRYHAVLVLARTGATTQAMQRFVAFDLSSADSEDTAALEARLVKDMALGSTGEERVRLAREASLAYRQIRDRTNGYFPAINAATLALIAGDPLESRSLANDALELLTRSGDKGYFATATEAEALLLMGDATGAHEVLERAGTLHEDDFGALATTRRQLRLICDILGVDRAVLAPLAGPVVAHFCGHRITAEGSIGRFLSVDEPVIAGRVIEAVRQWPTGIAYGSLASGGDILWAEALLADGCELHVVLPFVLDEFIATSVADAGAGWVTRFQRCLEAATSVTFATEDSFLADDVLYAYCSQLAMGSALLRARYLDADVHQFALWDGSPPVGDAGTAADVEAWRRSAHRSVVVGPAPDVVAGQSRAVGQSLDDRSADARNTRRVVRSMLMGDIRGYSKLNDEQVSTFSQLLLTACADVLSRYDAAIEYRNTWGDALFVVLSDPVATARCGLDLQDAVAGINLAGANLPDSLALRLSGHIGPIFPVVDPVLRRASFSGSHITRVARLEPVTPPGALVVTEAFAAALELSGCADLICDYVGHRPAAKDYGRVRMYTVERTRR
jgi:class 3 adenylate cyclase